MTICWARNSVSLWMARERIAFECGRKNIGLSRITKDEETQTSNSLLAQRPPRTKLVSNNNSYQGSFPLSPEIPKISVRSNLNIWDHLWRWSTLRQAWSFLSIVPKCPFPFDKIVVRSTAPLSPADNYNNQTRGWLGSGLCNRNVLFHQAREMSEFSQAEFLLNGKCPWM